MEKQAE